MTHHFALFSATPTARPAMAAHLRRIATAIENGADVSGGLYAADDRSLAGDIRILTLATDTPSASQKPVAHPAAGNRRPHWSEVLEIDPGCSTSEARRAFNERLAAIDDTDPEAEKKRQLIREAINQRLAEDNVSE